MITVIRKDKEPVENLIRRFTRKVQQSGILFDAKQAQHFDKGISKSERRRQAILRKERRDQKLKKIKLGQK